MITFKQLIETALDNMFQGRETLAISRMRAEKILTDLAHEVTTCARDEVLMSLKTSDDVAKLFGVSIRRIQAIAKKIRDNGHPVGWPIPGTNRWLFLPAEVKRLKPGRPGRPGK